MPNWFGEYERSRASWTPEQRQHVRAILLFMAYTADEDNNLPHHSMLAGHPNFVMDVKQTLAIACAVFPNHPHAPRWRDSFVRYYNEGLDTFARKDDPAYHALGGRWTENIACYSGTSLLALLHTNEALQLYDGTDLLDHPGLRAWVTAEDFPAIYQLKPGASFEEEATEEVSVRRYRGQGDFLTMVAPDPLPVEARPFGAVVNDTEYIFFSQRPIEHTEDEMAFSGRVGYARSKQLALFDGAHVRFEDFEIRRETGDFGISAAVTDNGIVGRIAGRSGGRACITLPSEFDVRQAQVIVGDAPVKALVAGGAVCFSVDVSLRDGYKTYSISF